MKVFVATLFIVCCHFGPAKSRLFRSIIDLVDPFNLLHPKPNTSTIAPATLPPPVKAVDVEETIFQISAKLQALFDTEDYQVSENYIVSPICVVNLLGQLLLGNRGNASKYLEKLLELSPKITKREVNIVELTNDPLYDEKIYNPVFHWKIGTRSSQLSRPNHHYEVIIKNALVFQKAFELTEHFQKSIDEFYKTALITADNTRALSDWKNFGARTKLLMEYLQQDSLLLSRFELKSKFQVKFYEEEDDDLFRVSRQERVRVKYMQGIIRNTLYMNTPEFTLTVIPLQDKALNMYILLPKSDPYEIRRFSQSVQDFDLFKNIEVNYKYNFQDVSIRLPNIFPYTGELDVMKAVLNGLSEEPDNPVDQSISLNRAAKNLKVTNAFQQVSISIANGEEEGIFRRLKKLNPREAQRRFQNRPRFWDTSEDAKEMTDHVGPLVELQLATPFVFFIMQEKSKVVLLWGSISDPSKLGHSNFS